MPQKSHSEKEVQEREPNTWLIFSIRVRYFFEEVRLERCAKHMSLTELRSVWPSAVLVTVWSRAAAARLEADENSFLPSRGWLVTLVIKRGRWKHLPFSLPLCTMILPPPLPAILRMTDWKAIRRLCDYGLERREGTPGEKDGQVKSTKKGVGRRRD